MELPSTSKGFKKGPSSKKPPKNKAKIVESDSDDDTPLIELMRKKDDADDDDNFCSICKCDYNQYLMPVSSGCATTAIGSLQIRRICASVVKMKIKKMFCF